MTKWTATVYTSRPPRDAVNASHAEITKLLLSPDYGTEVFSGEVEADTIAEACRRAAMISDVNPEPGLKVCIFVEPKP